MRSRWWCLQHVPHEGPALIGEVLTGRGVDLTRVRLDLGEPVPSVEDVAGLVVMGGPMGALDDAEHPVLADERLLLAACVERGLPVLGVCLGAQLLAGAMGAPVYRGSCGEVGAGTVELTAAGRADPVLGASVLGASVLGASVLGVPSLGAGPLPVVHWHHDTFDLPPAAVLLASSERYAHQAFRIGERAYGLQFHVELGPTDLPMLEAHMNPARVPTAAELAVLGIHGRPLLERFADVAGVRQSLKSP